MLRILWVCNVPNQQACEFLNIQGLNTGGWLTGLSKEFEKASDIVQLFYCFPYGKKQVSFKVNNVFYYSFYEPKLFGIETNRKSRLQNTQIKRIIEIANPDIVHIFGTEFYHSLCFLNNSLRIKTICSVQGLTSIISKHFCSLLPADVVNRRNISSVVKGSIKQQAKKLEKRGKFEVEILNRCRNVIGRTDWDFQTTYFINKNRKYFKCNESLRDGFYDKKWNYQNCKKHQLFISQSSSPAKGLNVAIEAISLLVEEYPDITLKIAGNDFLTKNTFCKKLKYSTYANYISKLIKRYNLSNKIIFCGNLNESQMIEEYLTCNLFLSPSSIENSSNSICEAMILGVPVISSDVGGVRSLMENDKDGLTYQADAPYMLAASIKKLFDDHIYAEKLGSSARAKALVRHDRGNNFKELCGIYLSVIGTEGNEE